MKEIELFNFEDHEVRTVLVDGEPWFVAKDVTDLLGFKDGNQAIRQHVLPGQRGSVKLTHPGSVTGYQTMGTINEAGLYRLIMRSKVAGAERFQDWVTSEVLPTIRKTGGAYITPGSQAELDLTNPDTALDKLIEIAQVAKEARARAAELEAKVEADAPMVLAAREFFDTKGLIGFRESSRALGLRQSDFMTLLRSWGWVDLRGTALKAYAVQQGYGKNLVFAHPNGQTINGKLTRKGLERATVRVAKEIEA